MQILPARLPRRTRRFMLTPLVDVIFLLLTFFMLSSHVAPYSLLSIAAKQQAAAENAAPTGPADTVSGLLVSIAHDRIQANGTNYSTAEFRAAAGDLARATGGTAVVLTKSSATVQDVVSVLEILKKAEFASVSVRMRASPKAPG